MLVQQVVHANWEAGACREKQIEIGVASAGFESPVGLIDFVPR
jgi:hypothetical protein